MTIKVGILGSRGYLGSLITEECASRSKEFFALPRELNGELLEELNPKIIFDASFPRNYQKKEVRFRYLTILEKNILIAANLKIPYYYLGSYSSLSPIRSIYAETKMKAEEIILKELGGIIRLGLVIDKHLPGGRFAELGRIAKKIPINIIIGPSWCPVTVTDSTHFQDCVKSLLNGGIDTEKIIIDCRTDILHLNELLLLFPRKNYSLHLNEHMTNILMYLVRKLPIGKLDNLKSIAYKEEKQ